MSVEFSTSLGYGFIVHDNEVENLPFNKHDDFIDNDYTIRLNCWSDTSDYFFGLTSFYVEPGAAVCVPTKRTYPHDEVMNMISEFKTYFPEKEFYIPKDYILSQIY